MSEITRLLCAVSAGDSGAADELFPLVYDELNHLAAKRMADENPGNSLCSSDLVHEAYLRLIGPDGQLSFENRRHFYGSAARAMRQILVDAARRRGRAKRGGNRPRVDFVDVAAAQPDEKLAGLEQALGKLAVLDPVAAEVVDMHHFAGLNYEKTAELMGTSMYEVRRKWVFARAWLSDQLK